jgi:uncharacterized protein YjaZ
MINSITSRNDIVLRSNVAGVGEGALDAPPFMGCLRVLAVVLWVLCYEAVAFAQPAAPERFKIGIRNEIIVPAFERQMEYAATARQQSDAQRAALYSKIVVAPVLDECAAGGEYADLGKSTTAKPPSDLAALVREIDVLRGKSLNVALKEGLRRVSGMLPGPDTTVCVLAADPAAGYMKSMHGVQGITTGAGKIWLLISPDGDWESWVGYNIAHEYHHSAWTARYYDKSAPFELLDYLVFEGRADAFAHIAYPDSPAPWTHALTREQEVQVWSSMREILATTDSRVQHSMMFGDRNVPGWAGYTIGFEIVESYLKRLSAESVTSWTAMKAQMPLDGSDFRLEER